MDLIFYSVAKWNSCTFTYEVEGNVTIYNQATKGIWIQQSLTILIPLFQSISPHDAFALGVALPKLGIQILHHDFQVFSWSFI